MLKRVKMFLTGYKILKFEPLKIAQYITFFKVKSPYIHSTSDASYVKCIYRISNAFTAAWLAQLGERRSTEREVAGSNPGRTNTQGL